jgi:beta-lactamase regulating signal transducer with metallopeptidase domain
MNDLLARTLIVVGGSTGLSILLKATLIMLVGLGATRLAASARASVRHLLLASTFVALLLLPAALLLVPAAVVPIVIDVSQNSTPVPRTDGGMSRMTVAGSSASPSPAGANGRSMPTPSTVIRVGWATGFALLIAALGVSLWRLSRIRRLAYPWPERYALVDMVAGEIGLRKRVALALHEDLGAPITCGTRRPLVILPSDATTWSDADVRRALVHEMEHVRRNDWAMQLVARATFAMYWFHPLVWTLWRDFCLEAERACDDAVLSGADRADYADQLVQLARRMSNVSTVVTLTMASRSDLSTRVSAILDEAQKRGPVGILPMMTTATAALVVAFALAPLRAVEKPQQREPVRGLAAEQAKQIPQNAPQSRRRVSGLDRALFEAARDGDIADMTALLGAGANANAAIPGDGSALIGAASSGHLDAVRFLLDRGADPNLAVGGDGTALIAASRSGRAEVAALLLDRGADMEQVVPGDENPLIQASGSGKLDVARLLVSRGANVNARVWADRNDPTSTGEWRSPLLMAKRGGHQAVVEYLISVGAIE